MNKLATFFRDFRAARFFIPAGVILLVFSVFVFMSVDHAKGYVKTEAEVTKLELAEEEYTDNQGDIHEATYDVYVKYTVGAKEYEEVFGTFSGYKKGDKITILYNPDDPKEITQTNSIVLPIVIVSLGGVFLTAGIISTVRTVKKRKALKLQEKEWSK